MSMISDCYWMPLFMVIKILFIQIALRVFTFAFICTIYWKYFEYMDGLIPLDLYNVKLWLDDKVLAFSTLVLNGRSVDSMASNHITTKMKDDPLMRSLNEVLDKSSEDLQQNKGWRRQAVSKDKTEYHQSGVNNIIIVGKHQWRGRAFDAASVPAGRKDIIVM